MSIASYRLESPRPRPPPLPLRTGNLPARNSQILGHKDATETLLYDLPSSNPTSPTRLTSPTSPTTPYSPRSGRRVSKMTSPKNSRSNTPSRPMQSELEEFAELCRAWYYQQDDDAGRRMTQTLATLPPAQRAPFARLQASIRSAYHASVSARRDAEFKAHLNATKPGGSLMPHSRADPKGPLARKERYERLDRFIRTWCTMGMPGTKPFFQSLWAVMRLQVVPQELGGAGPYRIEWEIDDAVFKESGGKDFMLEAIDVLKGVLAFEDTASLSRTPSTNSPAQYPAFAPLSPIHSRSQSQPSPTGERTPTARTQKHPPIASTTQTKRPRAPSDPFLDTPTLSTSYSSANTALSTSGSSAADEPITPTTPAAEIDDLFAPAPTNRDFAESDGCYLRTWTAPDLSNPEFLNLLTLFPPFIVQTAAPRFPVTAASRRLADIEEGQEGRKEIRVGTGTMWLGPKRRADGYQGGWWTRFRLWLARLFC
ncbi:hypothetical protein DICSQDRAFT_99096 [Dichomitus squalens LYAD-421 SS1]|uniref:uncharacterized protein n=1 Tax=Dichomitus squalens (strain LYAD-421) TaxID=732165 RepID=UPI0004413E34|nr:uncharacterized protein DICSQDRAFT_99096 [Dichomitus squalens LYAD-421 SS1]EJF65349.1 hypothetical protein DICSQDRAFT_99096 [Dichomitus squalens LYAD-421 SS1]